VILPVLSFLQAALFFEKTLKDFTERGLFSQEQIEELRRQQGG
jgi:hypothetical protein